MNLKIEEESILDQDEGSNHLAQAYRHLKYQAAPRQAEILGGPLPPGTPLTTEEFQMFLQCRRYQDIRLACDTIKHRREGSYPPDWWEKMMSSGLYDLILNRSDFSEEEFDTQTQGILREIGVTL